MKEYLEDLYNLGIIQGEHNSNWSDEYNLLEHSRNYYHKTKAIADKYGVRGKYPDEDDYMQLDMLGSVLNERAREHILQLI